ncbi:MAG: hypothetical protein GXP45_06225 [bacterium]|nr:hypothetical protein [bacterium]
MAKKRILTGVKPTGSQLHIGNYFGAIKPMLDLAKQDDVAEVFLFLANLHAFTTIHDPKTLQENSINILKLYMACGADTEKFFVYSPSDIP